MDRRQFLAAATTALGPALAGCGSSSSEPAEGGNGDGTGSTSGESADASSNSRDPPTKITSDSNPGLDSEVSDGESSGDGEQDQPTSSSDDGFDRSREFRQTEDPWSNREQTRQGQDAVITVDCSLAGGRYATQILRPQRTIDLSYSVALSRDDDQLEVFLIDRQEFARFRNNRNIVHYQTFYSGSKLPSASGSLPPGHYMLIFDNSVYGKLPSHGPVSAEVEMTLGYA